MVSVSPDTVASNGSPLSNISSSLISKPAGSDEFENICFNSSLLLSICLFISVNLINFLSLSSNILLSGFCLRSIASKLAFFSTPLCMLDSYWLIISEVHRLLSFVSNSDSKDLRLNDTRSLIAYNSLLYFVSIDTSLLIISASVALIVSISLRSVFLITTSLLCGSNSERNLLIASITLSFSFSSFSSSSVIVCVLITILSPSNSLFSIALVWYKLFSVALFFLSEIDICNCSIRFFCSSVKTCNKYLLINSRLPSTYLTILSTSSEVRGK